MLVKNRDFFIPPAFDAPVREVPVGMLPWGLVGETITLWLPDGETIYSFRHNRRTWQTDRRTDTARQHRTRLCIASRGKNVVEQYVYESSVYHGSCGSWVSCSLGHNSGSVHAVAHVSFVTLNCSSLYDFHAQPRLNHQIKDKIGSELPLRTQL